VTRGLPPDLDRFLARYIDTVEQLEVLLLLHQGRDEEWTAERAARALYSQPGSIARRLASLAAHGFLEPTGAGPAYRYAPRDKELAETVSQLARTYRERRVAVITAIASRPMENVRAFSDAFRVRRKTEDE